MNQSPCPMCGKNSLTEKHGEYRFEPPEAIPGGAIVVPDAAWYECGACHEQIVPPALENAIERERYRRLGLLTPEEIKAVRERTGLSAVDMATLLGVGEKTYTRWENGRSLQNKSNDTLIRLVDRNAEIFEIVARSRTRPARRKSGSGRRVPGRRRDRRHDPPGREGRGAGQEDPLGQDRKRSGACARMEAWNGSWSESTGPLSRRS